VVGEIILRRILESYDGDIVDWLDADRDSEQWRALVNITMNLRVPPNVRKFLSNCVSRRFWV
jgi:hypothetical protein